MSNRENRILSAVDSLIQHIVPKDPREDPDDAQDRHDNCLELVTAIINGYALLDLIPFFLAFLPPLPPSKFAPAD